MLPVIFFSGTQGGRSETTEAGGGIAVAVEHQARVVGSAAALPGDRRPGAQLQPGHPRRHRPCCRCCTCPRTRSAGSALIALVAIGLGLIFPQFEAVLEKPFCRLPQKQIRRGQKRFRARPGARRAVRAVRGTGARRDRRRGCDGHDRPRHRRADAVVRRRCRAAAAVLRPGGRERVAERVAAFRRRQRQIRVVAGIVTILLAVALVFNLPAVLQRAIPDYTSSLQEKVGGEDIPRELNLGGLVNEQNAELSNCTNGGQNSRAAAPHRTSRASPWLNTPGGAPVDLKSLRGKVVLIDFWAYSCINCQRAIPHVVDWYDAYRDLGLEVDRRAHSRVRIREERRPTSPAAPTTSASPTPSRWTTACRRGPTTATATGPPDT